MSRFASCLLFIAVLAGCAGNAGDDGLRSFLADQDTHWTEINDDYYSGALMGNGLLGTNFYKVGGESCTYRLDVGRSDICEQREVYNLFNKGRFPIGYFALKTVGNVVGEKMDLSIYDAETTGCLTTDKGSINFATYVHSLEDCIVFETDATGEEAAYGWDFVPFKATSSLMKWLHYRGTYLDTGEGSQPGDNALINPDPTGYVNAAGDSNPASYTVERDGVKMLVQPLAKDTTFTDIAKYYVVAWKEVVKGEKRRIIATVAFEEGEEAAEGAALATIGKALKTGPKAFRDAHRGWWHGFYGDVAYLTFPDPAIERFYWMQYYKFASTGRPGKPVVDLQGVWPTFTPWPAIWTNLNIQLTYSFQTKANMGEFSQPLWDALWEHRDNLQRNVTDVPGQETWTDAMCLGRTCSYDFYDPLNPRSVIYNVYEVGNLCWTLFYWYQQCLAYGDEEAMRERLFPLLKAAVNLFFHIRITGPDGKYSLPSTASPEYEVRDLGPDCTYDLANLRQALIELIDIDGRCGLNDPMLPQWQDFLDNLVDYPYSEETGFKVSETTEFSDTSHRHFSHLFMLYPYHLLDWNDPDAKAKANFSIDRWHGNCGYSNGSKAAMLASEGLGDPALEQVNIFMNNFLKPNTLYAEAGPCMETPFGVASTLHDFYLQDWGDRLRVFYGCPSEWKDVSFKRMRAAGAFLVSAGRKDGKTSYVEVYSEKGNVCRIQTDIRFGDLKVTCGGKPVDYKVIPSPEIAPFGSCIEFETVAGTAVTVSYDPIPAEEMQAIYDEVKTPYKVGMILEPEEGEYLDNPAVFRGDDAWYMLYVRFDMKGYETHLAKSDDLIHWEKLGLVFERGQEGAWDASQADGWPILLDERWEDHNTLKQFDGKYWMMYLGGAFDGYETDPLSTGVAWTDDPTAVKPWTRCEENPVLQSCDPDARHFEKTTIFKHYVVEDPSRSLGGRFVTYYNASNADVHAECIGMAISDDLTHWKRYGDIPVIDNVTSGKFSISGDPMIKKIGDLWVMFFFGCGWPDGVPGAYDTFACSRDLVHWTQWDGAPLIQPSESWDQVYAHKPWVIKHDGVVYHFYCAVGDRSRGLALATSVRSPSL